MSLGGGHRAGRDMASVFMDAIVLFCVVISTWSTGHCSVEAKGSEVAEEWPLSAHSFSPFFHSFVSYGFRYTQSMAV